MTDKTISLTTYYYKKGEIDGFLANKANVNHSHGNIDKDGEMPLSQNVDSYLTVNNIAATNSNDKIIAVSGIPSSKVIYENGININNILDGLYQLIASIDDRDFYEISRNGEGSFNSANISTYYSYMYFTKIGQLVIGEFGLRSDEIIDTPSNIPDAGTTVNGVFYNKWGEFTVSSIPDTFKPISSKYIDSTAWNGNSARVIVSSDGNIRLHVASGKKLNTYGCFVYFIDTDTYLA